MSNPLKKLAGQTAIYGLGTIVPKALNQLLTPILTYTYAPAEYGINGQLYSYISFLNIVFTYGMETSFFNFYSKNENKNEVYNTAMFSIFSSTVALTLLLLACSSPIASWLSTPAYTYLPQFIVWSVLILATDTLMAIPYARMRLENRPVKFSLLKLTNVLLFGGLTVFFCVICKRAHDNGEQNFFSSLYDPRIGIGYVFLANLIANIISLALLGKQFSAFSFRIDTELLKQMLHYAWPLLILGLAGMVNETLDRLILKVLMPDKDAGQIAQGIYSACYKVAMLMSIFIQAFRFAADPFFFSKSKDKDSKQTYALVMKYFMIFCSFLFLGTMMNLDWIKYFIGKEYRVGLKIVPVLLMAYLCLGAVANLSIWFKLSSKTKYGAVISITGALVTIIVNCIFVPSFGYVACAWATLAAYFTMMVVSYVLGQKYYPIRYNIRAILVFLILAFGLYLLSFTWRGLDNLVLKLALNNLLVLLFAWLFYKLEFSNLKKLKQPANDQSR